MSQTITNSRSRLNKVYPALEGSAPQANDKTLSEQWGQPPFSQVYHIQGFLPLGEIIDGVYITTHKEEPRSSGGRDQSAYHTMLSSEAVLAKDWDTPEEDEAWADL
jgi:hypothetical protein